MEKPALIRRPDGTVLSRVPDSMMSELTVTRSASGKLVYRCGQHGEVEAAHKHDGGLKHSTEGPDVR